MNSKQDKKRGTIRSNSRGTEKDKNKEHVEKKRSDDELFSIVFGSPEGKRVLRWIFDECGYEMSSTGFNPTSTEINPLSTIYNEARRNLYIKLRKKVRPQILKVVEFKTNK